jgi:hypothetical protein
MTSQEASGEKAPNATTPIPEHYTIGDLCLAKMSSARNRAQSLTVKTAVGSCASPKFDLPSSY